MTTRTREKSRLSDQRGATAVEFAVIAALLFVILFGILEFGFIFLQEHFVANAAREGMRIGVRANNYNAADFPYNSTTSPDAATCDSTTNRSVKIDCQVRDYLETLYDRDNPVVEVVRLVATPDLQVTVTVNNFYPPILSALVELLPGTGGFSAPETMTYTAVGEYEDRDEWDEEAP